MQKETGASPKTSLIESSTEPTPPRSGVNSSQKKICAPYSSLENKSVDPNDLHDLIHLVERLKEIVDRIVLSGSKK